MFLVNSRLDLFTAALYRALFLPKVQSQFAEFLRESYLAPLSLFNPRTCVGLRYRHYFIKVDELFLEKMEKEEIWESTCQGGIFLSLHLFVPQD